MTRLALTAIVAFALGCSDAEGGGRSWIPWGDERTVASSAGDAELDANGRLNFEVTSDVYRRWMTVQSALGRSSETRRFVTQLGRRAITQEELDDAVARVQGDAEALAAIEGAGMSPLEYVYATVAIEQAMAVASGKLAPRKEDAGVPRQNVDIVGRYQDSIVAIDTSVIVLPEAPPMEPVPVPEPQPEPQPTVPVVPPVEPVPVEPQPLPTEPVPTPVPSQPRPALPAPTQPVPAQPAPTQPAQPTPTDPAPRPDTPTATPARP